jgi:hypothetical protein
MAFLTPGIKTAGSVLAEINLVVITIFFQDDALAPDTARGFCAFGIFLVVRRDARCAAAYRRDDSAPGALLRV